MFNEMHFQPFGDLMKKQVDGDGTKPLGLTDVIVDIRISVFIEPNVAIVVLVHHKYLRNNQLIGA